LVGPRSTQDPPKIHLRSTQDPFQDASKIHSRSTQAQKVNANFSRIGSSAAGIRFVDCMSWPHGWLNFGKMPRIVIAPTANSDSETEPKSKAARFKFLNFNSRVIRLDEPDGDKYVQKTSEWTLKHAGETYPETLESHPLQ
jgi:hypothetical protein